jgi:site-specific recombinase XerD
MKSERVASDSPGAPAGFPEGAALAALRAWYEGVSARDAVSRYLGDKKVDGESARGILGRIRRQLVVFARDRHLEDLATLIEAAPADRTMQARAVADAIETLRHAPLPEPLIGDDIAKWLAPQAVKALKAHGIRTLAALTVRIPRRRRWWTAVPGLGAVGARQIEAFFAQHPDLTERARALVADQDVGEIVPWEQQTSTRKLDGTSGTFRAPANVCALGADNDYAAVNAWIEFNESPATQRAYRKEAERLMLWAIVQCGKPLSSLTVADASSYRAFLRHPTPRARWVGMSRPRSSPEWRPFTGDLAPRSVAYSLAVLGSMFRWLIQQRYVLTNPFAGVKVRGADRNVSLAPQRAFADGEWNVIQTVAEGLERIHGWQKPAAQRLRFALDFSYATGLRASEFVDATVGQIDFDEQGEQWLHVIGKGVKAGKVALPQLATEALDLYLMQRQLPTTPTQWDPSTPLLGCLGADNSGGISSTRLWSVMKRFFAVVAEVVRPSNPGLAEKLLRASPHWMRHTHATHALERGVELTAVRDNLRHASVTTTSLYLHNDEVKRKRQFDVAFASRRK